MKVTSPYIKIWVGFFGKFSCIYSREMYLDKVLILIGLYFHIFIATGEFYAENYVKMTPFILLCHHIGNFSHFGLFGPHFCAKFGAFQSQVQNKSWSIGPLRLNYNGISQTLPQRLPLIIIWLVKARKNLLLHDRKPLTLALFGYSRPDPNDKNWSKC